MTTIAGPAQNATDVRPAGSRGLGAVPLTVWLVTALHVAVMAMCTFLYPAGAGYDEAAHTDMTYAYYNGHGFYAPGDRHIALGVHNAFPTLRMPPLVPLSDTPVAARGERRSFDALGGETPTRYPNQMVQHPPLYYALGAGILKAVPGSKRWPYDRWIAALRYLSIVLVAPIPLLAWATAKVLVGPGPIAVTASILTLTLPNLQRVGASVNNDNALTLLTAAVMYVLVLVIAGDLRKRTGLLVGVLTGLACLAKAFALVLPVAILGAYALAWARHRRPPFAAFGCAAVATAAIGAWWWIRNVVEYHAVQPDGLGPVIAKVNNGAPRPGFDTGMFVPKFFNRIVWRTWGGIGYPEHPWFSQEGCWVWASVVLAGLLLVLITGGGGRYGRAVPVALLAPTVLTLLAVGHEARIAYLRNGRLPGIQGRYLYSGVTVIAVLVSIGLTWVVGRRLARWLPITALLATLATQAFAWRLLIMTWWVPASASDTTEDLRGAFSGIARWSPWAKPVTVAPFVLSVVCAAALLAAVVLATVRRRGDGGRPVGPLAP